MKKINSLSAICQNQVYLTPSKIWNFHFFADVLFKIKEKRKVTKFPPKKTKNVKKNLFFSKIYIKTGT